MKSGQKIFLAVVKVIGQVLLVFGLLGWMYGVLIQMTHPDWLPAKISHLTPWLRLDTFTILCFIGSGVGFFLWRLVKELSG